MQPGEQVCKHQLKRPPELLADGTGKTVLLYECLIRGSGFGLSPKFGIARLTAWLSCRLRKSARERFCSANQRVNSVHCVLDTLTDHESGLERPRRSHCATRHLVQGGQADPVI